MSSQSQENDSVLPNPTDKTDIRWALKFPFLQKENHKQNYIHNIFEENSYKSPKQNAKPKSSNVLRMKYHHSMNLFQQWFDI